MAQTGLLRDRKLKSKSNPCKGNLTTTGLTGGNEGIEKLKKLNYLQAHE